MNNARYLVVKASGGGGLGDSIKSVLVAALYAELSHRSLHVDWSGGLYANNDQNAFSNLFRLKNIDFIEQLPDSDDVFPPRWKGRLEQSLHRVYTQDGWQSWDRKRTIDEYSFDLAELNHPADVLVMWEFDQVRKLLPHFPQNNNSLNSLFRYAAHRFLQLHDDLEQFLKPIADSFNRPILGVHIRKTHEFESNKGKTSLASYIRKIDSIGASSLFLATDNSAVKEWFVQRYPETIALDKWFAKPGQALHMNLDTQGAVPDKFSILRDALSDIILLSRCNEILITPNSSFSEIAHYFADDSMVLHQPQQGSLVAKLKQYLKR